MIIETWAERRIWDITRRECCHTMQVKARMIRLHALELLRRMIRCGQLSPDSELAAYETIRAIVDRL